MNGRRKRDPERTNKAKAESAKPVKVWQASVLLKVYADDAYQARERMQAVVEHWHVYGASFPTLAHFEEVRDPDQA